MNRVTEETFEQIIKQFQKSASLDLRTISFIDPYGMLGILELGKVFHIQNLPALFLPESIEVLTYLERMDFVEQAYRLFKIHPAVSGNTGKHSRNPSSDVLLEITLIKKSDDIHFIVSKVRERAQSILATHLHYGERAIAGFIVALSEACQNIIEHSNVTGFVGIQKYYFQRLKKNIVQIAVMDNGIGFRQSLSKRFSLKGDFEAIEKALIFGASRYDDQGRGHGLAALKRFVNEWNGKLSVRSGTAKISILPEWAW